MSALTFELPNNLYERLLTESKVIAVGWSDLTFVAADDDLIIAAQAEGLEVANPNHPP